MNQHFVMNSKNGNGWDGARCGHQPGRDAFHSVTLTEGDYGRGRTLPYQRRSARLDGIWWFVALCVGVGAISIHAGEAGHHHHEHNTRGAKNPVVSGVGTNAGAAQAKFELPPLPKGVSELKFSEFFVRPVGKRGLELTEQLRQLDGKRVRMLGYMVNQEEAPPGRFLFTPVPAEIHEHDNGLADNLPASTVFVSVPTLRDKPVAHKPGLMLLTGTLNLGNRAEPDGRISVVRLALDPPEAGGK